MAFSHGNAGVCSLERRAINAMCYTVQCCELSSRSCQKCGLFFFSDVGRKVTLITSGYFRDEIILVLNMCTLKADRIKYRCETNAPEAVIVGVSGTTPMHITRSQLMELF